MFLLFHIRKIHILPSQLVTNLPGELYIRSHFRLLVSSIQCGCWEFQSHSPTWLFLKSFFPESFYNMLCVYRVFSFMMNVSQGRFIFIHPSWKLNRLFQFGKSCPFLLRNFLELVLWWFQPLHVVCSVFLELLLFRYCISWTSLYRFHLLSPLLFLSVVLSEGFPQFYTLNFH